MMWERSYPEVLTFWIAFSSARNKKETLTFYKRMSYCYAMIEEETIVPYNVRMLFECN